MGLKQRKRAGWWVKTKDKRRMVGKNKGEDQDGG